MRVILASKSPRRQELLKNIVKEFDVIVSNADETFDSNLTLEEQSKQVSYNKAKTIFNETTGDRMVIGSDTIVIKNSKLYGKPKDKDEAFLYLKELNNSVHQVVTSIVVMINTNNEQRILEDCTITNVYIDNMSDKEIEEWINSGKAMDKAGAYAIQDEFSKYIVKIDGDYNSVVGLPVNKLYNMIKDYID